MSSLGTPFAASLLSGGNLLGLRPELNSVVKCQNCIGLLDTQLVSGNYRIGVGK